ncbi:MAG: hypothetical protein AAFY71_18315 [Bacteroidota bacterium]
MRHLFTLFATSFLLFNFLFAQVYVGEGKQTRHRFAQMTMGLDFLYVPQGGIGGVGSGVIPFPQEFPDMLRPRLSIGGMHFWGHADFHVSFPLLNILGNDIPGNFGIDERNHNPGVETGLKIYPWRIQKNRIAPFVGAAWAVKSIQMEGFAGRGPLIVQNRLPLTGGFSWQLGNLIFDAGVRYESAPAFRYPTAPFSLEQTQTPKFGYFLGAKWLIETTLSAERSYQNGKSQALAEKLASEGKLNGFSLAIGPSSAFTIGGDKSTYKADEQELMGVHKGSAVFPEFGVGYYVHSWDAHANVSFRRYFSVLRSFENSQILRRRSFTLEGYKYLFDYHGFVPFVGINGNLEFWRLQEGEDGELVNEQFETKVVPGITFGWDIRPDDIQGFILRTNLRYTPYKFDTAGDTFIRLHQLEFNFIQLVIYPGRMKRINHP